MFNVVNIMNIDNSIIENTIIMSNFNETERRTREDIGPPGFL